VTKGTTFDFIKELSPDVVVNTIAFANVDFCETNKEDAYLLHVQSTSSISDVCKNIGSKLIHFSTDFIFDGKKAPHLYAEQDIPNPLSYYGETRLAAEKIVLKNSDNIVIRTAAIYGWHPKSRFLNFVIDKLKTKQTISAFTDQINTPTFVDDLAVFISRAIEKDASGIYNAVGSTCLSRFEFSKRIAEKFSLDDSLVMPDLVANKPQVAKRPAYSCLDNSKAFRELDIKFSTVQEGLSRTLEQSMSAQI
jgi:dTDP-4-dehydrorhamnose reductase